MFQYQGTWNGKPDVSVRGKGVNGENKPPTERMSRWANMGLSALVAVTIGILLNYLMNRYFFGRYADLARKAHQLELVIMRHPECGKWLEEFEKRPK